MKRTICIMAAILLVMGLLVTILPSKVQAKSNTTSPGIAAGSWTTGEVVDITQPAKNAPDWLQLLSGGVKVTAAGKICHPLRGGQFGWVGEIRQLKDGKWEKLVTTNDWVPSKEGQFMACAEAPSAGTYALFGYYIAPDVVNETEAYDCSTVTWTSKVGSTLMIGVNTSVQVFFGGSVSGISDGTAITYKVTQSNILSLIGATGTITPAAGAISDYLPGLSGNDLTKLVVTFTENEHGCSSTSTYNPT